MFKLNYQITSAEYSLQKEKTDLIICAWKSGNEDIYADFLHRIDEISNGDLSVLTEMLSLAKSCIPSKNMESNIPKELLLKFESPAKFLKRLPRYIVFSIYDLIGNELRKINKRTTYSKEEYNQIFEDIITISIEYLQSCTEYIDGFLANLHNETVVKKNPLLYCMYYFVVFDYGLTRMMQVFDKIISNEYMSQSDLSMIRCCINFIIPNSMQLGKETKQSWEKDSKNCNREVRQEVSSALHNSTGNRGRKKMICSLDELLKGDKIAIKDSIKQFLKEHTEAISLAYLLKALVNANKINKRVEYIVFHRSIELFSKKEYGIDTPQNRYGELKELSLDNTLEGESYIQAKKTIDKWTTIFKTIS